MIGAIAGDIIGSVYEWNNIKTKQFDLFSPDCCFTDDSVLTVALAESLLTGTDYVSLMKAYYRRYPDAGYGGFFHQWARAQESQPYNSWGNGAAMRISSVGFAFNTLDEVLLRAAEYTAVTHNHPEGIKGAQATAAAIFLARAGSTKADIRQYTADTFHYDLSRTVDEIRPTYQFNESSQRTVPEAIVCFLESTDFEDAIRNAISLGGDSDTLACITGGIAQAHYGVPPAIADRAMSILDKDLRDVTARFMSDYCLLRRQVPGTPQGLGNSLSFLSPSAWNNRPYCANVRFMRFLWLLTVALICLIIIAGAAPAPQSQDFNTNANLSVDNAALTLSSAVAIAEARNYPAGYSWVRIHFYAFPLTPDDIAAARTGDVQSLDQKANKNSFDPKTHTSSHGTIQLSVDKDFKVWQVDMSIPGHGCTIAPYERDVQSFLQTYHYDGKNLRLKSKSSFICDLKSVGAGEKTYKWDIDVTLPVFERATPKK